MIIEFDSRNLRKAAFAVAMGFTLGRVAGKCVKCALNGAVRGTIRYLADNGNLAAQELGYSTGIIHKKEEILEPEKIKMGFHV